MSGQGNALEVWLDTMNTPIGRLLWMSPQALAPGRQYLMQHAGTEWKPWGWA